MEREQRLLLAKKRAHEVPVFRFIAVRNRLVHHHRHLPHFGVLFLDDVLARLALHRTRKEQIES